MLTDPRADTSGRELAVVETNSIVPGARRSPTPASAAGFAADLAWERAQEQAAIAYRAGDPITPTRLWAAALDIAEKHFGPGDPRLASSLTNNGLVLRRRRQDHQAKRMFQDALDVWDASWRWIHLRTGLRTAFTVPTTSTSTTAMRVLGSMRSRARAGRPPWRWIAMAGCRQAGSTTGSTSSRSA